ncbi:MAG: hypothetical protein KGJ78_00405 [Alphaproteobacteria bacterium]|nr:hypothetical protein [Alphaproteobacteria bacterium]
MWSIRAALVALVCVLIAGTAYAEAVSAPAWKFSATFPCQSQISTQTVDTAAGKIAVTQYVCDADDGNAAFIVAINDYPSGSVTEANVNSVYSGGVNGFAEGVKGTIRNSTDFALGSITGRETIIDIGEPKGAARVRAFLVGDRLYQVVAIGVPGTENSKAALDFLDSFNLTTP